MNRSEVLDALLYAWLSEGDARRAEVKFACYFRRAFSDLNRYARSLGAEAATAQDISQQSLIKLFDHLGQRRRGAAEAVRVAVVELCPLDFGSMHERHMRAWLQQIIAFRDAALDFQISSERETTWRQLRSEVNSRVDPLVRQGVHFLEEARTRLGPLLVVLMAADGSDCSRSGALARKYDSSPNSDMNFPAEWELRSFVLTLLQRAEVQDAAEIDAALGYAGSVGFVRHTTTVCDRLPALAIPSNSLLYTIVKHQFLDTLKATRPEFVESMPDIVDEGAEDVLNQLDFEPTGYTDRVADSSSVGREFTAETTVGDKRDSEIESRYRAFLDQLRAPLTRAEGLLEQPASLARATAQQRRADSLRAKYDRLVAVLGALRETPQPTEDQIAGRLGVTRNQVKYAIERIREEFNYCFPDLAGAARQRRKHQGTD
jgi:hypothetical protein